MQGLIIVASLGMLLYLLLEYKKGVKKEMLIAFLISLAWVSLSGIYGYRDDSYILFGINLFPLVAWTAGLVLLKEIYEKWFKRKKDGFRNLAILYVLSLIVIEYIGYNWLCIQLSTNYEGLLGINALHMPWFGKLYYLTIGPAYIWLTDYWRVK